MSTKSDIINEAYQEIRISGLTVTPSPGNLAMALSRLESMMAEFFTSYNLNIGYRFENAPDINTPTGVPLNYKPMMVYNLAIRLIPAFNKQVPQTLLGLASSSFSAAVGAYASQNTQMIQPPRRMPRGSGNNRQFYYNRYMAPAELPPNEAATNYIDEGETQDYQESFAAWLGNNTIASFTIEADDRLTIVSSANNDPVIDYTITARTDSSQGPWQVVKITVTDSEGRVAIRLINFDVQAVP